MTSSKPKFQKKADCVTMTQEQQEAQPVKRTSQQEELTISSKNEEASVKVHFDGGKERKRGRSHNNNLLDSNETPEKRSKRISPIRYIPRSQRKEKDNNYNHNNKKDRDKKEINSKRLLTSKKRSFTTEDTKRSRNNSYYQSPLNSRRGHTNRGRTNNRSNKQAYSKFSFNGSISNIGANVYSNDITKRQLFFSNRQDSNDNNNGIISCSIASQQVECDDSQSNECQCDCQDASVEREEGEICCGVHTNNNVTTITTNPPLIENSPETKNQLSEEKLKNVESVFDRRDTLSSNDINSTDLKRRQPESRVISNLRKLAKNENHESKVKLKKSTEKEILYRHKIMERRELLRSHTQNEYASSRHKPTNAASTNTATKTTPCHDSTSSNNKNNNKDGDEDEAYDTDHLLSNNDKISTNKKKLPVKLRLGNGTRRTSANASSSSVSDRLSPSSSTHLSHKSSNSTKDSGKVRRDQSRLSSSSRKAREDVMRTPTIKVTKRPYNGCKSENRCGGMDRVRNVNRLHNRNKSSTTSKSSYNNKDNNNLNYNRLKEKRISRNNNNSNNYYYSKKNFSSSLRESRQNNNQRDSRRHSSKTSSRERTIKTSSSCKSKSASNSPSSSNSRSSSHKSRHENISIWRELKSKSTSKITRNRFELSRPKEEERRNSSSNRRFLQEKNNRSSANCTKTHESTSKKKLTFSSSSSIKRRDKTKVDRISENSENGGKEKRESIKSRSNGEKHEKSQRKTKVKLEERSSSDNKVLVSTINERGGGGNSDSGKRRETEGNSATTESEATTNNDGEKSSEQVAFDIADALISLRIKEKGPKPLISIFNKTRVLKQLEFCRKFCGEDLLQPLEDMLSENKCNEELENKTSSLRFSKLMSCRTDMIARRQYMKLPISTTNILNFDFQAYVPIQVPEKRVDEMDKLRNLSLSLYCN